MPPSPSLPQVVCSPASWEHIKHLAQGEEIGLDGEVLVTAVSAPVPRDVVDRHALVPEIRPEMEGALRLYVPKIVQKMTDARQGSMRDRGARVRG